MWCPRIQNGIDMWLPQVLLTRHHSVLALKVAKYQRKMGFLGIIKDRAHSVDSLYKAYLGACGELAYIDRYRPCTIDEWYDQQINGKPRPEYDFKHIILDRPVELKTGDCFLSEFRGRLYIREPMNNDGYFSRDLVYDNYYMLAIAYPPFNHKNETIPKHAQTIVTFVGWTDKKGICKIYNIMPRKTQTDARTRGTYWYNLNSMKEFEKMLGLKNIDLKTLPNYKTMT